MRKQFLPFLVGAGAFGLGLIIFYRFTIPSFLLAVCAGLLTHYIINYQKRKEQNAEYTKQQDNARRIRLQQKTAISGMYAPSCRVCWHGNLDGNPHDCSGRVTYGVNVYEGQQVYEGQLMDGMSNVRWGCGHAHTNLDEATNCAFQHLWVHQQGNCICTYFCPPIDEKIAKSKRAYVYLMKHDIYNSVKVGISGGGFPHRVMQHVDNGWTFVGAWLNIDGVLAYQIEQSVIGSWRMSGFEKHLKAADMPQGGATETVSQNYVSFPQLINQISMVAQVPYTTVLPERKDYTK